MLFPYKPKGVNTRGAYHFEGHINIQYQFWAPGNFLFDFEKVRGPYYLCRLIEYLQHRSKHYSPPPKYYSFLTTQ